MKQNERIGLRLQWHTVRVKELEQAGIERAQAHDDAFNEVWHLSDNDLLAFKEQVASGAVVVPSQIEELQKVEAPTEHDDANGECSQCGRETSHPSGVCLSCRGENYPALDPTIKPNEIRVDLYDGIIDDVRFGEAVPAGVVLQIVETDRNGLDGDKHVR